MSRQCVHTSTYCACIHVSPPECTHPLQNNRAYIAALCEGHGKCSRKHTCVICHSPSCTDPHCHWSTPSPKGLNRPIRLCVTAFSAGVACGRKFKRDCVSCRPQAEASINMIPIVLASVLIASGKNIWHSLILCVIGSVCLQVCLSECVFACTIPHRELALCSSLLGRKMMQFVPDVGIKINFIVLLPHEHALSHVHHARRYISLAQPLGAAPHPFSP